MSMGADGQCAKTAAGRPFACTDEKSDSANHAEGARIVSMGGSGRDVRHVEVGRCVCTDGDGRSACRVEEARSACTYGAAEHARSVGIQWTDPRGKSLGAERVRLARCRPQIDVATSTPGRRKRTCFMISLRFYSLRPAISLVYKL